MDGQTKPVGPVRGRFGVTRDADGSLSLLHVWPWYWRYPLALCAGSALTALLLSTEGGQNKLTLYLVGGVGGLFILSVAYELFATLIVAGLLWWLYDSVSDSNGGWRSTVELIAGGFVVVGVYHLLRRADDTHKALSESSARLAAVESRLAQMQAEASSQSSRRDGLFRDDQ
jgi:hypothetical protein